MELVLSPAALNTIGPKPGVSENYQFMPTPRIIDLMGAHGYEVTKCNQGRSRKPDGSLYAVHRVHFRKYGQERLLNGEISPEIILINSHNRGAALRLLAGYIRWLS